MIRSKLLQISEAELTLTQTVSDSPITIRTLQTPQEMNEAVRLQKVYWGDDMGDMVPQHMLLSMAHYGGHIFAAFVEDQLVGILMGFLGADLHPDDHQAASQRLLVMSKRMVVLPEYRGRKIGEYLKLAQRDYALRHQIKLVTWTFDPMLSRNAYLNIHKLRGVVQKYIPDFFGQDALNPTLRADRVSLSWWVNHERVTVPTLPDFTTAPVLNITQQQSDGLLLPSGMLKIAPSVTAYRVEIPAEFVPYERINPPLGQAWRMIVRECFQTLLDAGYVATDFVRVDQRSYYVFTRDDGSYQF